MVDQVSDRTTLEESAIFHILGNDRRRFIIQRLASADGTMPVSELASVIAELEAGTSSDADDLYKSVYVSLQQTHLPRLEEDGIVAYDHEEKTVTPGPYFDDVLAYIEDRDGFDRWIHISYLILSVVGLVSVVVSGITISPLDGVDVTYLFAIVFFLIGLSSVYRLISHSPNG